MAQRQRRTRQPRPAEGDVGHRALPHSGARRPCRALPRPHLAQPLDQQRQDRPTVLRGIDLGRPQIGDQQLLTARTQRAAKNSGGRKTRGRSGLPGDHAPARRWRRTLRGAEGQRLRRPPNWSSVTPNRRIPRNPGAKPTQESEPDRTAKVARARFSGNSPLEGTGFELSVRARARPSLQICLPNGDAEFICTTKLLDHATTKSLILRRLHRDGANEAGSCEASHQKTVGNKDGPI